VIHAVLDANVLVSGFPASTNAPALIINRWRAGQFQIAVSQHILDEVERTWGKPYWQARFSPSQVERALELLRRDADVVSLAVAVSGVASHPEDDLVIATAVSANVAYLVTGDRMLQRLGVYEGVSILSPQQFLIVLDHESPV
jgi:putative PIN family toxin of toxin-antitoxin system